MSFTLLSNYRDQRCGWCHWSLLYLYFIFTLLYLYFIITNEPVSLFSLPFFLCVKVENQAANRSKHTDCMRFSFLYRVSQYIPTTAWKEQATEFGVPVGFSECQDCNARLVACWLVVGLFIVQHFGPWNLEVANRSPQDKFCPYLVSKNMSCEPINKFFLLERHMAIIPRK